MNPFAITDTYQLMDVVDKIAEPAKFLSQTFFNRHEVSAADHMMIEYTKEHRRLAPYVAEGARGVNSKREPSRMKIYTPPLSGTKRILSREDISRRIMGEQPILGRYTAQQRMSQIQGRDLRELKNLLLNKQEKMCADLLTTGQIKIRAFADDGQIVQEPTITFDEDYLVTTDNDWSDPTADIYGDLKTMCDWFASEANELPDVMICGANVESYLFNNKTILEWTKAATGLTMMNLQPRYETPQTRRVGLLSALGLEIYSYLATYVDDMTGEVKPFIPANHVVIGRGGSGRMLFGRVDILQGRAFTSYAAEMIPFTTYNEDAQTASMTVYSRCLPVPDVVESFRCMKVSA